MWGKAVTGGQRSLYQLAEEQIETNIRLLKPGMSFGEFVDHCRPVPERYVLHRYMGGQWLSEIYITNLTNKNAVIYTNEGNFDLRCTRSNEPRVIGLRFSYRWGKPTSAAE
jgi:Xaa-Pro aminopeptidase